MEFEEVVIYEQNPYEEIHISMDLFIQQTPFYPVTARDFEVESETEDVESPEDGHECLYCNEVIDLTTDSENEELGHYEHPSLVDQYGNPVIVIDD